MVPFLAILLSTFVLNGEAHAIELKTGDVLLQSVSCYLCTLIEKEEDSPYSHAGVVLREGNQIWVAEAWGKVEKIPLATFLGKRRKTTETLALRAIQPDGTEIKFPEATLSKSFDQNFVGHSYDSEFLWDNRDSRGEKYYCSEFVVKFLNPFLPQTISTKPMHYNQYREKWVQYFKGLPPDGKPGVSPGDLERSPLFRHVGNF